MMTNSMYIIIIFVVLLKSAFSVDYCGLCENGTHTMCRYKGPAKNCPGYRRKELSFGEKKYIVDIHNDIRNHVASGMETRGALGSQPPAADMSVLEWDDELAEIAQRWADQCVKVNETTQHDICKRTERFEVGQNILTAITNESDLPDLSVLIFNWYQQVTNMVPSDIDVFLGVKKGKYLIGQYTQLVWSETRYVGCGIITFTESDYEVGTYQHRLVCNYGPAGNIIGEAVYQRGPSCTKCSTRRCDTVRTSLCQGTDSKKFNTKFDPIKNGELFHPTNTPFTTNVSDITVKKINNAICLNPDDSIVRKCITGISQANVIAPANSFTSKDRVKYITFAAMASDKMGLHKPDQTTLKNLIALWKKLKVKNVTDSFNIFLSNNWTQNVVELDSLYATNTSIDLKKVQLLPDVKVLANLTKSQTEDDFLKNASYISTVIPSIIVTNCALEEILDRNMVVFPSSQEGENKLSVYDLTKNVRDRQMNLHYLENGIILGDGGEKHYRRFKDKRLKALQSYFKLNQDFTNIGDLDLLNNGHFRKAKGTWHNGHCICEDGKRSAGVATPKLYTALISVPLLMLLPNIIHII